VELDEIDVLAWTVLRYFEQVHDAHEPRPSSQLRRDVGKADREYGIDLDLALFHPITVARDDARTLPDSDAAGDVATTDAIAQTLREDHAPTLA
jgi:hypothetical protein